MPCLEAVVHITQSTLHQLLVCFTERSACDVTTCTTINGPTFGLTRIDILILIEARVLDIVGHVVTILVRSNQ